MDCVQYSSAVTVPRCADGRCTRRRCLFQALPIIGRGPIDPSPFCQFVDASPGPSFACAWTPLPRYVWCRTCTTQRGAGRGRLGRPQALQSGGREDGRRRQGVELWRLPAAASSQSRRQVGRSSLRVRDRQGHGSYAGIGITPINFTLSFGNTA